MRAVHPGVGVLKIFVWDQQKMTKQDAEGLIDFS